MAADAMFDPFPRASLSMPCPEPRGRQWDGASSSKSLRPRRQHGRFL